MYLSISFYSTLMIFIYTTFIGFYFDSENDKSSEISTFRLIYFLSWIFKGVFGFISDKYYPFYYRSNGYIGVLTLINFFLSISITLIFRYFRDQETTTKIMMWLVILSLAFLDSIARRQ